MKWLTKLHTILIKHMLVTAALCTFLIVNPISVNAFDNDTHYVLTYYLALKVGYSIEDAFKIALGDVCVDFDEDVGPFRSRTAREQFHAFISKDDLDAAYRKAGIGFLRRRSEQAADIRAKLAREIWAKREGELWKQAVEQTGNPGMYLHYLQDEFAHEGFTSSRGHLRRGHAVDFLSFNRGKALAMTKATVEALQRFRFEYQGKRPATLDQANITQFLDELIEINKVSRGLLGLVSIVASPDYEKALKRTNLPPRLKNFFYHLPNCIPFLKSAKPGASQPKKIGSVIVILPCLKYDFDQAGNPLTENWALSK